MTHRGPWIQTFTGKQFHFLDPQPHEIDPMDIAHALAFQCRFNGHTKWFYTVAQHSYLVARCLPKYLRLPALLHDAAEAYIGDIPTPIKNTLPNVRDMEERLITAIFERFKVPPVDSGGAWLIDAADKYMLFREAEELLTNQDLLKHWTVKRPDFKPRREPRLKRHTPLYAKWQFNGMLRDLAGDAYRG